MSEYKRTKKKSEFELGAFISMQYQHKMCIKLTTYKN